MAAIEFSDAIKREMRQVVTEIVRNKLDKYDKVATGLTRKSISTRIRINKNNFTIQIRANEALLYIIDGRQPQVDASGNEIVENRPPIGVVEAWLDARGLDYDPYAVQRSININGFMGLGEQFDREIRTEVTEAITNILLRPVAQQEILNDLLSQIQKQIKGVKITR